MDLCVVTILEMETLGGRIRFFRNEKGWSLEELGRRADVSKDGLWKIETDQVVEPYSLNRIAEALGLSISELRGSVPRIMRGSELRRREAADAKARDKIKKKQSNDGKE